MQGIYIIFFLLYISGQITFLCDFESYSKSIRFQEYQRFARPRDLLQCTTPLPKAQALVPSGIFLTLSDLSIAYPNWRTRHVIHHIEGSGAFKLSLSTCLSFSSTLCPYQGSRAPAAPGAEQGTPC